MTRTVSPLLKICMTLALATAAGCLATPEDISGEETSHEEDSSATGEIASVTQPLSISDAYHWQQGWSPVKMRASNTHFCYLTAVGGAFRGAGEWVHVFLQNGYWYLNGDSQAQGVSANAHCVPLSSGGRTYAYTAGKFWSQGQAAQSLATADGNTACVLTFVSGHFEGSGESVKTYISNGTWYLGGSSQQTDVTAYARCITGLIGFTTYNWTQNDPYPFKTQMELTNSYACGLSRMTGQFHGAGESVAVSQSGGAYYLTGTSAQQGVAATARCFH